MPRKPSAKQKKLMKLLPNVAKGKMTKTEALLKAGYKESTANEQSRVLGSVGKQEVMQKALRDAGMDEDFIAKEIATGAKKLSHGKTKLSYLTTGAKLLDVVPSQKLDGTMKHSGRVFLGDVIDSADEDEEPNP